MTAPATCFTPAAARAFVEGADPEDDWTYRVKDDPSGKGYSLVEIFDEDGEFVGYWTG